MRKVIIGLMLALAVLAACGDDDAGDGAQPGNLIESGAEALDDIAANEFVTIDGQRTTITDSCVDNAGVYKGQVEGGGLFILRGGGATGQDSFVDFQPAGGDPLSSQTAEDTVLTQQGTLTTGTSTVTTQDGANSLELQFQISIGEIDPAC